jgi:hypothetical protein
MGYISPYSFAEMTALKRNSITSIHLRPILAYNAYGADGLQGDCMKPSPYLQ